MGWGPPTCLSHLIRDELWLRLAWPCGHTADLEPKALKQAIYERHNDWWAELKDLQRYLRCRTFGGKSFARELVRMAPGPAHSPGSRMEPAR